MFDLLMIISLTILTVAILLNTYRAIKGPSNADRIQALDSIGINLIAGIAIFSVFLHTYAFFELILLIGILSFIGTIAFSRYLERGVVIERNKR